MRTNLWKHVQQEAAQEFIERKSQQLLFVVVSGVAQRKGSSLGNETSDDWRCHAMV